MSNVLGVIQAEKGEYKNILFTFKDQDKTAIDISTGWTFEAVAYNSTTRLFTKENADFNLSGGEDGELRLPTNFSTEGKWRLMLTATRISPAAVLKPKFVIEISEETIPAAT